MSAMGIIKIEISVPELKEALEEVEKTRKLFFEDLSRSLGEAAKSAIDQAMGLEIALFLGQKGQESNKRNGYRSRNFLLKGLGGITLSVPKDRRNEFKSKLIPEGELLDPRVKEDLAVFQLAGLSTRTLAMVSQRLLGLSISHGTVSSSLHIIEESALKWLERPLLEKY